jgi:hypothetical protein
MWLPWVSPPFCFADANRRSTAGQNSLKSAPIRQIDDRPPETSTTTNAKHSALRPHNSSRNHISKMRLSAVDFEGSATFIHARNSNLWQFERFFGCPVVFATAPLKQCQSVAIGGAFHRGESGGHASPTRPMLQSTIAS